MRGRFQVLAGHVRLTTGTQAVEAVAGDLFTVPAEARTLDAVEDSALLLAVALSLGSPGLVALAPGAGPGYSWQEDWSRHAASSRSPARPSPGSCSGSPVTARTVDEPHRAATQLEVLFDLTFVVAVVAVVTQLDHGVAERHAADVVGPFPQVFFALW